MKTFSKGYMDFEGHNENIFIHSWIAKQMLIA